MELSIRILLCIFPIIKGIDSLHKTTTTAPGVSYEPPISPEELSEINYEVKRVKFLREMKTTPPPNSYRCYQCDECQHTTSLSSYGDTCVTVIGCYRYRLQYNKGKFDFNCLTDGLKKRCEDIEMDCFICYSNLCNIGLPSSDSEFLDNTSKLRFKRLKNLYSAVNVTAQQKPDQDSNLQNIATRITLDMFMILISFCL